MTTNVWAVTMVRDELDILPSTLQNMVDQGVAGLIVADNGSTDGTWEWLKEVAGTYDNCDFMLFQDSEVGYYQSRKMTELAQKAFAVGAEWVIPFDADELWVPADHAGVGTVVDIIEDGHYSSDVLQCQVHNYFPTSGDEPSVDPIKSITWRDPNPAPLVKVIVRNRLDVTIMQGNHDAIAPPPFEWVRVPIQIAHYPWRTYEQFERKVRNGAQAYAATDLSPDLGAHWRQYGQILDRDGPAGLREVFDTWFHDPEMILEHRPQRLDYNSHP